MRFKSHFLFFLISGICSITQASHIVGGEMQMIHQRGEIYLLRLILYYDQANAEFNLVDRNIEIGIFRKSNNTRIDDRILDVKTSTIVDYANPYCLEDSLKTIKITYEGLHRFSSERYYEDQGYYFTWERCCRNNIISNVFQPGRQGMVFLLEFPDMDDFPSNSRPLFKEIQGEYICRDRYVELDYSAIDIDGDSLSYSLATPIAGFTTPDDPISALIPGPYPFVENYFLMPGTPNLKIDSRTGILSARPSQNGLYVFRVICNEFRDGKKIGAVHRDFQILVDQCVENTSPQTQIFNQNSETYNENDTLVISSRDELCFDLKITDSDNESRISYEIVPVNFESKVVDFSPENGALIGDSDTLKVKMCWPDCIEPINEDLFEFWLLVKDNACPMPNTDSTKIILKVEEESNSKPLIESEYKNTEWPVGNPFNMWLSGYDKDLGDSLSFSFKLKEGALIPAITQNNFGNDIDGNFTFLAKCSDYREEAYEYTLYVKDNSCASNNTDSLFFTANVNDYIPYEQNVIPPTNVITPNGDGLNEYFYFPQPLSQSCEFQNFETVTIYNRWGREVFKSDDREFKWYAENLNSGQYFYLIQFDMSFYKGFIHVIK